MSAPKTPDQIRTERDHLLTAHATLRELLPSVADMTPSQRYALEASDAILKRVRS